MSACISPSEQALRQQLLALSEAGLPLVDDPWAWLAERLQLSLDDCLALLQRLQGEGAIRRIAAVPNHYRLGYRHNGMTVWDVSDEEMARLGPLVGSQPFVSHCTADRAAKTGTTTCSPWCMAARPRKSTIPPAHP